MMKRLLFLVIIVSLAVSIVQPSYAVNIYNKNSKSNLKSKLVNITKPNGDESIFGKLYLICGYSKYSNVNVKLLIYNKNKGKYEDFETTSGESSWKIGASGVFVKEVKFLANGANCIRLACYQNSTEDVQIEDYTITVLKDSFKDVIREGLINFSDVMWYMF